MNPAIVMLPTPLMASNFSTRGTFRIISSSTLLTASNCEFHKRYSSSSIYNSLFVPVPPSSPTLLCAASTRIFALSSVTPLPRIFLSYQIFRNPFTPSAITSFGNGIFQALPGRLLHQILCITQDTLGNLLQAVSGSCLQICCTTSLSCHGYIPDLLFRHRRLLVCIALNICHPQPVLRLFSDLLNPFSLDCYHQVP